MSFTSDLAAFNAKQRRLTRELFLGTVTEVERSIVSGSSITGAPGQPVDTGNLKGSWQVVFDSATQARIVTNVIYAQPIEEGTRAGRALVLRSKVGGFHSVEKTVQGFGRIQESVAQRLGAT